MKTCWVCNRRSVTQEFVWENGKWRFEERCINPNCRRYKPYIQYRIKAD